MKGKIFRHYKTKALYEFIGSAKLESTLEEMAIYRRVSTFECFIRPMKEWLANVQGEDGIVVYRFEKVKDEELQEM